MLANESTNGLIAGASRTLLALNWPQYLVIYQSYYLQSVLYSDAIQGLQWYIVVLLPAPLEQDHLQSNSPLYIVVILLAAFAITVNIIGGLLVLYLRKSSMVKLSQPLFTWLIITGDILLDISAISLLGANTYFTCVTRLYLFNASFTLAFVPLLIKSWRVHILFNLNPLAKKKLISNWKLVLATLSFVITDILLLSISSYGIGKNPRPSSTTQLTKNGAYAELTYCGYHNNSVLFATELCYKGVLIVIACYYSIRIRNVVGAIAGSKTVFGIVYNTAFTCLVIILITRSVTDTVTVIVCEALGICFCTLANAVLLVAPVLYHYYVVGDANAAEEVKARLGAGRGSVAQSRAPGDMRRVW